MALTATINPTSQILESALENYFGQFDLSWDSFPYSEQFPLCEVAAELKTAHQQSFALIWLTSSGSGLFRISDLLAETEILMVLPFSIEKVEDITPAAIAFQLDKAAKKHNFRVVLDSDCDF